MNKEKLSVDWAVELSQDVLDGKSIVDKVRQLIDEVERESHNNSRKYYMTIFGSGSVD